MPDHVLWPWPSQDTKFTTKMTTKTPMSNSFNRTVYHARPLHHLDVSTRFLDGERGSWRGTAVCNADTKILSQLNSDSNYCLASTIQFDRSTHHLGFTFRFSLPKVANMNHIYISTHHLGFTFTFSLPKVANMNHRADVYCLRQWYIW